MPTLLAFSLHDRIWRLPAWLVIAYTVVSIIVMIWLMSQVLGSDSDWGSWGDDPISSTILCLVIVPFLILGLLWPVWVVTLTIYNRRVAKQPPPIAPLKTGGPPPLPGERAR